jgi:hypothetical protein
MQRPDLDIGMDGPPDVDTLRVLIGVEPAVASSD